MSQLPDIHYSPRYQPPQAFWPPIPRTVSSGDSVPAWISADKVKPHRNWTPKALGILAKHLAVNKLPWF